MRYVKNLARDKRRLTLALVVMTLLMAGIVAGLTELVRGWV